jgi:hypothetical protein
MNAADETLALPKRMQSTAEELANSVSHGIGLCAALIGAPILLLEARRSSPGFFLGAVIFVLTLSMLYLGSTLYHAWPQRRGKSILQVVDHSAIFLLIASLRRRGGSGFMPLPYPLGLCPLTGGPIRYHALCAWLIILTCYLFFATCVKLASNTLCLERFWYASLQHVEATIQTAKCGRNPGNRLTCPIAGVRSLRILKSEHEHAR